MSTIGYRNHKISDKGVIKRKESGKWKRLKTHIRKKDGYVYVTLFKNGKGRYFYIHRLVLIAFVGVCPIGKECRHKNGKRDDNRLENLKWGSPKRNQKDRIKHGTTNQGENHGSAKLSENDVLKIRKTTDRSRGYGAKLAKEYNVKKETIYAIIKKKIWKCLSENSQ